MNRFLAALALLILAAVPAAAQTNVVWGLATGSNPRNLCVYDSTQACVPTGSLDSTLHVFTPSIPSGTITSAMLAAGAAVANLGFTPLSPANNLSELTSAATARTNLGLGTAAVANTGTSGAALCLLNGACVWSGADTFATIPTFTAGQLPPANGGTGLSTFTRSGNTTDFATATGTLTPGHCVSIDASGNFIDAGGTCTTGGGGGTVTAGTVGQLAYYSGTTNTSSFALAGDCTFTYPNVTCLKVNGTAFSTLATLAPGTGVATALAASLNATGGLVGYSGALGIPTSGTLTNATGLPISTGLTGAGTGVITALGNTLNVANGLVGYSGALGTPTSGTLTNATGLPISTGLTGAGTGVASALGTALNGTGGLVGYSGALGTPTSGTLTNATGLPISTGVSGLGTNIPAALGTALNGTGAISATSNVTLITPNLGTPSTLVLSNATGLPLATGVTGTLLAAQEPAHTGDVTNSAGSLALAITANAVSNAKLAQMGAYTLKGNNTGSTANAADLTGAQVQAQLAITPGVANNAALTALASTYSAYVVRQGYTTAGDAPSLLYQASGSACSLNSGNGDNGSQVKSSDSKCWIAQFNASNLDPREWGAIGNSWSDSSTALLAELAYVNSYVNSTVFGGSIIFGTQVKLDNRGVSYATSKPLTVPSQTLITNWTLLALAGASWDGTSLTATTIGSNTLKYGIQGILNVAGYNITVNNTYLDCAYVAQCQLMYVTAGNNIQFTNITGLRWASTGNGFISNGATYLLSDSFIVGHNGNDPYFGVAADAWGMALGLINTYDSTIKGTSFGQALVPMYVDANGSLNRFIDDHPWQSVPATYYSTGTVSDVNGSATVTGVGTSWPVNATYQPFALSPGWGIYIGSDPTLYVIQSINSSTSITLTTNVTGSTQNGVTYNARSTIPWVNPYGIVYDGYRSVFIGTYIDSCPVLVRATSTTTPVGAPAPQVTISDSISIYASTASTFPAWVTFTTSAANTSLGGIIVDKNNQWDSAATSWTFATSGSGSWNVAALSRMTGYLDSAINTPGTGETDFPHNQDFLGVGAIRGALKFPNIYAGAGPYNLSNFDTFSILNLTYTTSAVTIGVTSSTPAGLDLDFVASGHATTVTVTGGTINGGTAALTIAQNKLYHINCSAVATCYVSGNGL